MRKLSSGSRVEIRPGQLVVKLVGAQRRKRHTPHDLTLHIPWHKPPSKRRREILMPDTLEPQNARPMGDVDSCRSSSCACESRQRTFGHRTRSDSMQNELAHDIVF